MSEILPWCLLVILPLLMFGGKKWFQWIGELPGDFTFHRGGLTVLVPLGTCLLLSIVLCIVIGLFARR